MFRENERYEQLNKDLIIEIENGNKEFERSQREYEALVVESLRLVALEAKTQQDYNQNKADTIQRTNETTQRTNEEIENVKNLKELQETKRAELKDIYEQFKELQKINDTIKKSLDIVKAEIGEKLKQIAELDSKNQALYLQLSENQQSHSSIMDSLQREAEMCKDQLKHERDTRLKKQAERETKLAEIEAFNANFIIFQHSVAAYLNDSKAKSTDLEEKEKFFVKTIEHNKKEKIRLTTELETAVNNYTQMKAYLENNVNTLEKEMSYYLSENTKNVKEIKEIEPGYNELCNLFREKCKEYDDTRKAVVGKFFL